MIDGLLVLVSLLDCEREPDLHPRNELVEKGMIDGMLVCRLNMFGASSDPLLSRESD